MLHIMYIWHNHSYMVESIQKFYQNRVKNAYKHMYTENIKNESKMVKMRKNTNFRNNHQKLKISSYKVTHRSYHL